MLVLKTIPIQLSYIMKPKNISLYIKHVLSLNIDLLGEDLNVLVVGVVDQDLGILTGVVLNLVCIVRGVLATAGTWKKGKIKIESNGLWMSSTH